MTKLDNLKTLFGTIMNCILLGVFYVFIQCLNALQYIKQFYYDLVVIDYTVYTDPKIGTVEFQRKDR